MDKWHLIVDLWRHHFNYCMFVISIIKEIYELKFERHMTHFCPKLLKICISLKYPIQDWVNFVCSQDPWVWQNCLFQILRKYTTWIKWYSNKTCQSAVVIFL